MNKRDEYAKRGAAAFLRRHWLRFTAPKECRQKWHATDRQGRKRAIRICNMTDAHVLNTVLPHVIMIFDLCLSTVIAVLAWRVYRLEKNR